MNARFDRRRFLMAAAGAVGTAAAGTAVAAILPPAVSLSEELTQALHKKQPLVVMVSLDGCPFCKTVRDSYLAPLREQEGLSVVQVDMRSSRTLRDLGGRTVTHDAMTRTWRVKIAPTVLFLGKEGQEVASRLIGAYLPDFYGAYLEERLASAHATLR